MSPLLTNLPALAANNTWVSLWPEISMGGLALLLLVLEIILPVSARRYIPSVAIIAQVVLLGAVLADFHSGWEGKETFNGLIRHSEGGQIMRLFFILCSTLVFWLARLTLARQTMPKIEFYNIVLVVSAAMMLLAQSNHFVMLFVALETVTIGLYILVSYTRTNALTLEAGLKYLIMGALSSSLLLFGIVLLYGVAGNTALPGHTNAAMHFLDLAAFLAANPHNSIAAIGVVLVVAGLAFKIGAFPFQIWIPDVYQGAPTPVTAFLAVASKAAGFVALLAVMRYVFPAYEWLTTPVLSIMAGATILFGNLAALTQHNVKRLIGLSGVSHAGFLMLGVLSISHTPLALSAIYFYLFAYLLANFAVFGVMVHLAGPNDPDQELEHYSGLAKQDPFLGTILAVGLGSLAGIPPLAGFVGKFLIFMAAYQSGFKGLLVVAILGVVISIYYYFGWLRAAFFEEWRPSTELAPRPDRTPVDWCSKLAAALLALGSIAVGFYPGFLGHMLHW